MIAHVTHSVIHNSSHGSMVVLVAIGIVGLGFGVYRWVVSHRK